MRKMTSVAVAVAVCFLGVSVANAAIVSATAVQVDNSTGGAALDGFVTNDILITFDGQYTGAQLLLEPGSSGAIYQDAAGGASAPNAAVVGVIPSLGFDSFIAQGSPTADGPNGNPSAGGGAVDLGADAGAEFSADRINQAFNPAGGQDIFDQVDFLIARITLRNDLNGGLLLLGSAGGQRSEFPGDIVGGVISIIPEPASLILGSFGILSIFSLRRRS